MTYWAVALMVAIGTKVHLRLTWPAAILCGAAWPFCVPAILLDEGVRRDIAALFRKR